MRLVSFPFPLRGPGYETVSVNVVLIPLQLVHQLEAELEDYEQFTGYSFSVSRPTVFQVDTSLMPRPSPHMRERGSGILSDFSCHMGRGSSPI